MKHSLKILLACGVVFVPGLSGDDDLLEALLSPLAVIEPREDVEAVSADADEGATVGEQPVVESMRDIDLISSLEFALVDRLGLPGRVELTSIGRLPKILMDGRDIDVVLLESPKRLTGSGIVLRYKVLRSGEPEGEWRTVFRCRHMAEVWVPTRRIDTGEALLSSDMETLEVDLIRNAKAVVADRAHFNRYELARAVYPGRPISWPDLAPRSLVRKGELVDVVVRKGYLSISMRAMATRGGALGDIVAVRNLESKREFPAEVIDEKTVQVFF